MVARAARQLLRSKVYAWRVFKPTDVRELLAITKLRGMADCLGVEEYKQAVTGAHRAPAALLLPPTT